VAPIANLFLCLSLVVASILILFSCVTSECVVVGSSMVPTYNADDKSDNDIVFVNKLDRNFQFLDVVVIEIDNSDPIIKRIIGVGGDVIDVVLCVDGYKLEINGKIISEPYLNFKYDVESPISQNGMDEYYDMLKKDLPKRFPHLINEEGKLVVPEGQYFVLGDNRHDSKDSMYYGTFSKNDLMGSVEWCLKSGKGKGHFYFDYVFKGGFFKTLLNIVK